MKKNLHSHFAFQPRDCLVNLRSLKTQGLSLLVHPILVFHSLRHFYRSATCSSPTSRLCPLEVSPTTTCQTNAATWKLIQPATQTKNWRSSCLNQELQSLTLEWQTSIVLTRISFFMMERFCPTTLLSWLWESKTKLLTPSTTRHGASSLALCVDAKVFYQLMIHTCIRI